MRATEGHLTGVQHVCSNTNPPQKFKKLEKKCLNDASGGHWNNVDDTSQ